ncbi:hypothetical protein MTO96_006617 [Rhipicephalus appendiculatus]
MALFSSRQQPSHVHGTKGALHQEVRTGRAKESDGGLDSCWSWRWLRWSRDGVPDGCRKEAAAVEGAVLMGAAENFRDSTDRTKYPGLLGCVRLWGLNRVPVREKESAERLWSVEGWVKGEAVAPKLSGMSGPRGGRWNQGQSMWRPCGHGLSVAGDEGHELRETGPRGADRERDRPEDVGEGRRRRVRFVWRARGALLKRAGVQCYEENVNLGDIAASNVECASEWVVRRYKV